MITFATIQIMKRQLLTRSILIPLFLTIIQNKVFSQDIHPGPIQRISYGFEGVYPVDDQSFFVAHRSKMNGVSMILTHYKDNAKDATTGSLTKKDCGISVVNGKMIVFEQKKSNGGIRVLGQEYGVDCKPVGAAKEVMHCEQFKGEMKTSIVQSANKKYLAVCYEHIYRDKVKLGFRIYDNNFSLLKEGAFDTQLVEDEYKIRESVLSDNGDLYCVIEQYKIIYTNKFIQALRVCRMENNVLNEVVLDFDRSGWFDARIIPHSDGTVGCFAISYGAVSGGKTAITGTLDWNARTFVLSKSYDLSPEFIGFQGKQLNYRVSEVVEGKNGESLYLIEQFEHSEGMRASSKGMVPYSLTTYYDVKVIVINKNQEVAWTGRLGHTNQVGFSGSYCKTYYGYLQDDKYIVYVNANKEKNGLEAPVTFTASSSDKKADKNNCIGKITLDMATGKVDRELLIGVVESGWELLEQSSTWDPYNNGILLVFMGGYTKFRFAIASL